MPLNMLLGMIRFVKCHHQIHQTCFFRKDFDPKGERTVGVLTKLDNLNSSTDKKRVSEILENKTKYLNLGKFTNPQSLIVMLCK